MTHPRRSTGVREAVLHGLAVGLAVSAPVPVVILLSLPLDELRFAYPLVLLPLLLAGPIAARPYRGPAALGAAAVAGIVSGVVASVSLAFGAQVAGIVQWGLTSAAAAPPMPRLPRVSLLPTDWMTWPQQDILTFQPILAVLLGLAVVVAAWCGRRMRHLASPLLPSSLGGRLRWAFVILTALTLSLGAVGFSMIEEMHYRIHRLQLQAAWQHDVAEARSLLDAEVTARLVGGASVGPTGAHSGETINAIFARLSSPGPRPGISVGADGVAAVQERYRPLLDDAIASYRAFRAADGDVGRLLTASASLRRLEAAIETDAEDLLRGSDLAHHERLIAVMALVALVASIGLWTGERLVRAIEAPLARLSEHLQRVAHGDFSQRVPDGGPRELRVLGSAVNDMTSDLARLYDAERDLSTAKEFWTNTLVHDLKGPLTLIAGWSELLEQGQFGRLDPAQTEAIRQLRVAAHALDGLVADINDSFRLQAGALPIQRAAIEPAELLRAVVDEYQAPRPAPDLRIASGLSPVHADLRLLGRVLHNLMSNAYKHAGEQARVALVAEPLDGAVLFAVDDDGPGIPVAERERVFERFIQGKGTVEDQGTRHGSGLGLAFCKLVVDQLGGSIWADSSPLGGTRIAFTLPLAPARKSDGPAPRAAADERAEAAPRVA